MKHGMAQKIDSSRADLLVVLVILIVGLKATVGLETALDISLYDGAIICIRIGGGRRSGSSSGRISSIVSALVCHMVFHHLTT